jgi:hypothetical protein
MHPQDTSFRVFRLDSDRAANWSLPASIHLRVLRFIAEYC